MQPKKPRYFWILLLFLAGLAFTALLAQQIHRKAQDRRQTLLSYTSSLAAQHTRAFLLKRAEDLNQIASHWNASAEGRRETAKAMRSFFENHSEYQCIKLVAPSGIILEGCSRSPSGVGIGQDGFNTLARRETFERAAADENKVFLSDILPLNTGVQGLILARAIGGEPPQAYVYSAVSLQTILNLCVDPVFKNDLAVSLTISPPEPLEEPKGSTASSFERFGRVVRVEMRPQKPDWPDGHSNAPAVALVIGFLVVCLIAYLAWRAEQERIRASISSRRLQTVVETTYDLIWSTDATGRLTSISPFVNTILGFDPREVLGRFAWEFMDPPGRDTLSAELEALHKGTIVRGMIRRFRIKNGGTRVMETTLVPLLDSRGELLGADGASRDVTDRHEAEERYRRLVESSQDIVLDVDSRGIIRFVNGVVSTILRRDPEQMTGKTFWGIFSQEEQARARAAVEKSMRNTGVAEFQARFLVSPDVERQIHFRLKREEGGENEAGSASCAFQAIGRDNTAQIQLENQILQFQKMEAIGKLAGGMAHDFNNLLTVILSAAEEAEEGLAEGSLAKKNLSQIRRAGRRAAELTRQVLTFSRRHPVEPSELQLNIVVQEMQVFLKRLLPPGVELQVEMAEALGWVMADRGQMEQVLINLVLNAKDAMPKGGTIFVATRNVELTDPLAQGPHLLNPGRWVVLEVKDQGKGIAEENIERIFEPFYTTKETGKGVGLGLSVVYGIVRGHQGGLHVETESGRGTTVRVFLPFVHPVSVSETPENGGQSIMLVEPEEFNRKVLCRLLEMMGYPVVTALDSAGARELAQRPHWKFDLLLASEEAAPEGLEILHRELAQFQPNLQLVVLEHPAPGALSVTSHPGICPPYDSDQVAAILREALKR